MIKIPSSQAGQTLRDQWERGIQRIQSVGEKREGRSWLRAWTVAACHGFMSLCYSHQFETPDSPPVRSDYVLFMWGSGGSGSTMEREKERERDFAEFRVWAVRVARRFWRSTFPHLRCNKIPICLWSIRSDISQLQGGCYEQWRVELDEYAMIQRSHLLPSRNISDSFLTVQVNRN